MIDSTRQRIGVLTAGGDCPGLNALIRGVTRTAIGHGYDVVGFLRGFEGLVEPVTFLPLNPKTISGILPQGGTILGSTNRGRFTATVNESDRVALPDDLLAAVKNTYEQLDLAGLVCVGGDGSLAIAEQFHQAGLPVVGVPKTIDNDLSSTAFTFGFDSAVACATDALDRLHTTAESHQRVMVLEVMGRHAGWIALFSGMAGGCDVILLPEITWSYENVCKKILERQRAGKYFTLVVVAEGAELPDGQLITKDSADIVGQVSLGGVGEIVAAEISERLGCDTRTTVLGHLQRGGAPTAFDRALATQLGAHATRMVIEQRFGEMVCYNPPAIDSVPIRQAIAKLSRVSPDGSAIQAARALGISFGDESIAHKVFASASSELTVELVRECEPETVH